MSEQLSLETALSVLIIGETMIISAGIMSNMDTWTIMKLIAGFAGIWVACIFVYRMIDCIKKVNKQ